MKIDQAFLDKWGACKDGQKWFWDHKARSGKAVIKALISDGDDQKLQWGNWLIARIMNKKQRVQYAIFAAEQVIGIFEKKYPDDKRPRKAIEAAKAWVKSPTKENAAAASSAAYAAYAYYAAYTATAAAYTATAAAYAAAAAKKGMKIRILKYGLSLLK